MTEIVAEAVRTRLAEAYAQGFTDGIRETLDQLEDQSKQAPAGGYRGTVPPELQIWIDNVRGRVGE
jgi:hypothetical protein